MRTTLKIFFKQAIIFVALLGSMGSCNKADDFYKELQSVPEIMSLNYKSVYEVGDTMTLTGRLNPEKNLKIHIGNADAIIVEQKKIKDQVINGETTIVDEVKLVITEAMGVGKGRLVSITSDQHTIQATSIEIYSANSAGYLSGPIKLVKQTTLFSVETFFTCFSGKGSVYYYTTSGKVQKIHKNGKTSTILDPTDLQDRHGTFTISSLYSGAIDPNEQYLYLSALTADGSADNANNRIFRLIKVNLTTKEVTTLNRTLFPENTNLPDFPIASPLEGAIGKVTMYRIGGIYPDREGNVYLQFATTVDGYKYATALLTTNGILKYIFKSLDPGQPTWSATVPGTAIIAYGEQGIISAEDKQMFVRSSSSINTTYQYSLSSGSQLSTHVAVNNSSPVIYGDFASLSGYAEGNGFPPDRWGFMPIPGARLLVLYYQGRSAFSAYRNYPAWGVLDFKNKRGDRYAPGKFQIGTYAMQYDDILLNWDEEGMLYMTTNNKTELVKTAKQ